MNTNYKSPLHRMARTTATDYWNDSCSIEELTSSIEQGAVGATSNPTIVLEVLKKEMFLWKKRIQQIIIDNPDWTEEQITWQLIEEMAVKGAGILMPVFAHEKGRKGRLSIQTNPAFYRTSSAMTEQGKHLDQLAPNMQIKIPATKAGIQSIEALTYAGISINATVSFTVAQAVAVAEAVERGLYRRQAEGLNNSLISPVCTLMIGRLDDWLQILIKRDGIITDPGFPSWAGIACFKKAYQIFQQRNYQTRLLAAAYRHHLHWSELIGGNVVLTIPYAWQKQFNDSDIEVIERMQNPVSVEIINELYKKFPDFRKAFDEDGLSESEFDSFGATVRTLRNFIASYHELVGLVRDFMLPNPDIK